MKSFLVGLLLWSVVGAQAQAGRTAPPQESPRVPSPAPSSVDAGDYVYVSAQGPRGADGALPPTFAAQVRQVLTNLKSVVDSAGLTMDHVVYTTVYLTDIGQYAEMNRVFGEFFGRIPPARAVLGVAALPDPPIEINAVWGRTLPRPTSRTSLFHRAFSLMIVCSFLLCLVPFHLLRKPQTILPLRWTSR